MSKFRINDLTDPVNNLHHLLKYDTTQGRFDRGCKLKEGGFEVNGKFVKVSAERDPGSKSTGKLLTVQKSFLKQLVSLLRKMQLKNTLKGGAKKVVITAPG